MQIAGQGRLFLCGIIAGMGLLFVYDMFRVWRRVISHGTLWIAIEDIFYWCGSAIGLFLLFYQLNDGQIRVFFLLAAFVGMCLYHKGISPGFLKAGTAVLGSLVKGIRFIGKGLFYPIIFRVKKSDRGITKSESGSKMRRREQSLYIQKKMQRKS